MSKSALLIGLIAAGLLGYSVISYIEQGFIPLLEKLAHQIGLSGYIMWFYAAFLALFVLLVLPAIYTILKKR